MTLMNLLRRRYLQQSLALAAGPALAARPPHLVLLGDSIFDNGAYTGGKPDVITHVRSLLARDGAVIESVPLQLEKLPADATQLVLSVGGNNALQRQGLLQARAASVAEAMLQMAEAVSQFEAAYRKLITAILASSLPLVVCTIYNGNFDDARYRRISRSAIALFNDAILRTAVEYQLPAIDLRLVCARAEDFAKPIEPSSIGAARIAGAIAGVVTRAAHGQGACVTGAQV